MQEKNDKLGALLKQWPEIEPRPAFDQDVLRKIRVARAAAAKESAGFGFGILDRLAARLTSVWGTAAAVVAALVIGFILASATPAREDAVARVTDNVSEWLASDSVSGNYVAILNGGGR